MSSIVNIQKTLYIFLSSELAPVKIYTDVPLDALLPYIKIDNVKSTNWLIAPISIEITCAITIFSQESSNLEVLVIAQDVKQVLESLPIKVKGFIECEITETNVYQQPNYIWCVELQISIKSIEEEKNAEF